MVTLWFDLDLECSKGSCLASKLRIEIIPDLRRNELSRIYAYMRIRSASVYMKSRSLLLLAFLLFLGLLAIVMIRRSISSMSESLSEPYQAEKIVASAKL